jgi:PmbA protein
MKQEHIRIKRKETSIKLQASEINSIRVKDIERNAIRVYKDGKIGISGAVGSMSLEELKQQAIKNLSSNIPYPYELEKNKKDHRDYTEMVYSENDLMNLTEAVLTSLKEEHDDFIYSESVKSVEIDRSFSNSEGLDLRYQDQHLEIGLIVKAKTSSNLFDTFLQWSGRNFDQEKFVSFSKEFLNAERNKVDLSQEGRLPVFFAGLDTIGGFLLRQLNGETYGNKASLFDGKLGEKVFNSKLTINQDRNPKETFIPFFDAEGVINPGDKVPLIENGVIKRVFTDKKNAKKFELEHTGSASGGYDDIPNLGYTNISPKVDSTDIKKTLNGEPAILILVAAGGEVNADGNYATPVQAAYLLEGEKIVGKLPDFNMTNSVFDMLGDDYIGTFQSEELYFGEYVYLTGCYMNVKK